MRDRMKLGKIAPGAIDWAQEPGSVQSGETGAATMRAHLLSDMQRRVVDYGAGYLADHWCEKGHILFVLAGALTIEHRDGSRYELTAGMSWHAGEGEGAPHRVFSAAGARAFIVD